MLVKGAPEVSALSDDRVGIITILSFQCFHDDSDWYTDVYSWKTFYTSLYIGKSSFILDAFMNSM